ncbi:MAG TPA: hypothetical protein VLE21_03615 [Candidatus Nitrosocosmicus sp.]|nr:hypothetical protein [Candidatus Nitrosocosmicus sp.]
MAIKNRIKIFYSSNLEDLEKQLNEFYAGPELQELITVKFEINTYPAKVIVEYIPPITTTQTTTTTISSPTLSSKSSSSSFSSFVY